jgi:hypothetical protein
VNDDRRYHDQDQHNSEPAGSFTYTGERSVRRKKRNPGTDHSYGTETGSQEDGTRQGTDPKHAVQAVRRYRDDNPRG